MEEKNQILKNSSEILEKENKKETIKKITKLVDAIPNMLNNPKYMQTTKN